MTPDDLWEKYGPPKDANSPLYAQGRIKFLAALQEYGNAVKAEAVKVLEDDWFKTQSDCAAAIKGMKLP